jgi:hypothetical protein
MGSRVTTYESRSMPDYCEKSLKMAAIQVLLRLPGVCRTTPTMIIMADPMGMLCLRLILSLPWSRALGQLPGMAPCVYVYL